PAGERIARIVQDADVGAAPGPRPGDDLGAAVEVEVRRGHADPAGEGRRVGEEAEQLAPRLPAEDPDVGAAAGVGADDARLDAVAVDGPGRHVHAAGEAGGEGEEVPERPGQLGPGPAVEDADVGAAARSGAGDDVQHAVSVHVAQRHPDAAGEAG